LKQSINDPDSPKASKPNDKDEIINVKEIEEIFLSHLQLLITIAKIYYSIG
jgi:hypothetical protein